MKTAALLFGASLSSSCSRAIISGAALDGEPALPVLGVEQLQKVAVVAELIVPETDTPGAIAAGVPAFIHRIVAEWYTPAEREVFLDGLVTLDAESRRQLGSSFLALTSADQTAVLRTFETQMRRGVREPGRAGPFFAKMKELTVLGYYTSEVGSQSELVYRPVPGAYDGHAHFAENSRQWAR